MGGKTDEQEFWEDVHLSKPIAAGMPTLCWYFIEDKVEGSFKGIPAYLYAWRLKGGPLPPPGYLLHHLCKNHWCVNPTHLVMASKVTHPRLHAIKITAFCLHGHPFDKKNPLVNGAGYRLCHICANEARKTYNQKQELYLGKVGKLINIHGANNLERLLGGPQYNVKNWVTGHQPIPTKYFTRIDELYDKLP